MDQSNYDSIMKQISLDVEYGDYTEALDLLDSTINELKLDAPPTEKPDISAFQAGEKPEMARYLNLHEGEPYSEIMLNAINLALFCVAKVELCANILGLGTVAAETIRLAYTQASLYPIPFNEMLMKTVGFNRLMWYPVLEADRGLALTFAYRLGSVVDDYSIKYFCQEIQDADDWLYYRYRKRQYNFVDLDKYENEVKDNYISGGAKNFAAWNCAQLDSVLSTLERGQLTRKNHDMWGHSLSEMANCAAQVVKGLSLNTISHDSIVAQYDLILKPVTEHILYFFRHGYKTDYINPIKLIFKEMGHDADFEVTECYALLKAAENGDYGEDPEFMAAVLSARTPLVYDESRLDTDIFVSTALSDKRIFLSSSFSDMHAERDYLLTHIFPRLDIILRSYGVRLSPVDLRGTAQNCDEDEYNRQCFKYCLDEVDNCRPMMIGIMGERYGWIPYNYDSDDKVMLEVIKKTAREHGLNTSDIIGKSMTHLEMMYGLRVMDPDRCYFYFRKVNCINGASQSDLERLGYSEKSMKDMVDEQINMITSAYGIRAIAPPNERGCHVQYYNANFDGKYFSGLSDLGENIYNAVLNDITSEFMGTQRDEDWYIRMENFWDDAAHNTIPHPRLKELLELDADKIYITGPEGVGKTVLLAQYREVLRKQHLVIAQEALLDSDVTKFEEMLHKTPLMERYISRKFANDNPCVAAQRTVVIMDGIERFFAKDKIIEFADRFCTDLPDGPKWILCGNDKNIRPPKGFTVFNVTEPPAPAESLIRNAAMRHGKIISDTITAHLSDAAHKGDDNPLFIDYIVRRLMAMLQEDYQSGDHIQWMDKIIDGLDGSIETAADLIIDRAARASEYEGIPNEIIDYLRSKKTGSATEEEIREHLASKGMLPVRPKEKLFGGAGALKKYDREVKHILVDCGALLKPLLVFDTGMTTWSLGHMSLR